MLADAAGNLRMSWRRRDAGAIALLRRQIGEAKELRLDAIADSKCAELIDTRRESSDFRNELVQQGQHDGRLLVQQLAKGPRRHRRHMTGRARLDGGGAPGAVDRGIFAEHVARTQVSECDRLASNGV